MFKVFRVIFDVESPKSCEHFFRQIKVLKIKALRRVSTIESAYY